MITQKHIDQVGGNGLVLVMDGRDPIRVRSGHELTIGRHFSNDYVINDRTVSRYHATINWANKKPIIRDLDSTCGVEVDGKPRKYAYLTQTHSIVLGGVTLHVKFVKSEEFAEEVDNPALLDSEYSVELSTFEDKSGRLVTNEDLCQLLIDLESDRRTGTLKLISEVEGQIIFGNGNIIQAKIGKLCGQPALDLLLTWKKINYIFTSAFEVQEESLHFSPSAYIQFCRKLETVRYTRNKTSRLLRKQF